MNDHHEQDPAEHWEARYRSRPQVWSGRVNAPLAVTAASLEPGRALDLGCGEGADAIWLAEHGWTVTATDISQVALDRGAQRAEEVGVAARISWERHDLGRTFPAGAFDLVSAQYLHSFVDLPRDEILRRGAEAVAPGGTLLVVGHAAAPPWAPDDAHEVNFPTAQDVIAAAGLEDAAWTIVRAGEIEREAVGPDDHHGTLIDSVVEARRR